MATVRFFVGLLIAGAFALAGCDDGRRSTLAPTVLDQRLTDIYARTCMGCHATPDSGAPQTHNTAMWEPRLKQGEDVLLSHIVDGFGGMPPLGQCVECSAEDLTTLMHFMASPPPSETSSASTGQQS
ncbi:MAG: c-type cytochrome [Pseudomonadota bacterium]